MNIDRIQVIIADDHDLLRDGFATLLETDPQIELLGAAANGEQLLALVRQYREEVDVVIADLRMPVMDGFEAIRHLRNDGFMRILALSLVESPYILWQVTVAGAMGCVLKGAPRHEVLEGIHAVYHYQPYYCRRSQQLLAKRLAENRLRPGKEDDQLFSTKELKILDLICRGHLNEEVAEEMRMSKRTVEGVRSRMMARVKAKTIAELVLFAVRNGFLGGDERGYE